MTNQEFATIQTALGLNNVQLAEKLGVHPSAVSKWRVNREVPEYIATSLEQLMQSIEITLPLNVIIALSNVATTRGISFARLITESLRTAAQGPQSPQAPSDKVTPLYPDSTADPAQRIAEDQP